MAKKYICTVCGYIHEGDSAPEKCPLCKVNSGLRNGKSHFTRRRIR